jgi:integrase
VLGKEIVRIEQGRLPVFLPGHSADVPEAPPDGLWTDEPAPLHIIEQQMWDDEVRRAMDPSEPVWGDRIANEQVEDVPENRTIGFQVGLYLDTEAVRHRSGQLSASELDSVRRCLRYFRDWIGSETLVERLNGEAVNSYYEHLLSLSISVEYKRKRLRFARSFIEYVATKGLIPIPLNLRHKRHRFKGGPQAISTMTVEEFRKLFEAAKGQLRLHLLLMANCGMTQVDVSDLLQSEVDWRDGRIIRKRSKTKDQPNVPTVNYKLWPTTFELLKFYREKRGPLVLLTATKQPWKSDVVRGESRSKIDYIAEAFEELGSEYTLKIIRKTSASLLKTQRDYQSFDGLFLAHSPKSVAERYYSATSQSLFDEAVAWLGQRYGFLPNA